MNRREVVQKVALMLGGTIVGADIFTQYGCKTHHKKPWEFFTANEGLLLNEISETILPRTDTPGAKDAKVSEFMNVMVRDCYTKEEQQVFLNGIEKIELGSKEKYGKGFVEIDLKQRTELLNIFDKEQLEYQKNKKPIEPSHFFRMMKELALLGFFTSEVGASQTLRYSSVPGKYEPSVPYTKGEKAWYQAY